MPRTPRIPILRLHKATGLAVVSIKRRDFYCGRFGTPEAEAEYKRLVAEWLTRQTPPDPKPRTVPAAHAPTVAEVIVAFMRHADRHYRHLDGTPTHEVDNLRDAVRPLKRLYAHTRAVDFGPVALRAYRDELVRSGLARTTVNARVNRVRRMFRWAASHELVPTTVAQGLAMVEGLRLGRTPAREADPVGPVPVEVVEATIPHLPRPVAAMVRLQLLTGCRASEVTSMRGRDITVGSEFWEYRPASHKGAHRGQKRIILLGPRAQVLVSEFLTDDPDAVLFAPHRRRTAAAYDRRTYRQAVVRGAAKAGVPRWSPLQLRHTAATSIRSRWGLEAAQVVLGHSRADVTQLYAERDLNRAREVIAAIG